MINLELSYTEAQLQMFFENEPEDRFIVVTKGRRFGATKGASNAFIEWMLEGQKLLWGDTISANIDRYVERYFEPELKRCKIPYTWSAQKKLMKMNTIGGGFCDFRSADRPENWEGFGYDQIFLNEAGIILKNDYLFTNAVLPMMMDYPDSRLYAAGVPKGKFVKDKEHRFYNLYKNAKAGIKGYRLHEFSSYDNPLLKPDDIKQLSEEIGRMNDEMKQQEIYGKFVEGASGQLWTVVDIEKRRIKKAPEFKRVVVAVDPAVSNNSDSDETGIVVVGLDKENKGYVIEDQSGRYSPDEWASVVISLVQKHDADSIVAEKNQGGDMVKTIMAGKAKSMGVIIRIKLVTATKGKFVRAEPIYALYEQGKIYHIGFFPDLERQMISFSSVSSKSPDRVDALVWGFTEILLNAKRSAFGIS